MGPDVRRCWARRGQNCAKPEYRHGLHFNVLARNPIQASLHPREPFWIDSGRGIRFQKPCNSPVKIGRFARSPGAISSAGRGELPRGWEKARDTRINATEGGGWRLLLVAQSARGRDAGRRCTGDGAAGWKSSGGGREPPKSRGHVRRTQRKRGPFRVTTRLVLFEAIWI